MIWLKQLHQLSRIAAGSKGQSLLTMKAAFTELQGERSKHKQKDYKNFLILYTILLVLSSA